MLNNIQDNPGSFAVKKRVGRGIGSGKGKTCGRGVKGQKSRSGVSINGFEGGQMSIYRRLPKRGFRSHKPIFASLNIRDLQHAIDKGKLQSSINIEALKEARLISRNVKGIRILGEGTLNTPLTLIVNGVSASARQKIESLNGVINVKEVYRNPEGKRTIRKKESLNKYKKVAV